MGKRSKPRAGSLAYRPKKRAKKETPRVHHWPSLEGEDGVKLLGFAGYKVGMTHVMAKDNRKFSRTSGLEIFVPVTVLETPPLIVAGIRAYYNGYYGKETLLDVFAPSLSEDLSRRMKLPKDKLKGTTKKEVPSKEGEGGKKIKEMEENLDKIQDITLIVHTQPRLTSLPKKAPDIMEIALSGSMDEKFKFAKEKLGKEISISEVFNENSLVDIHAVTKGKGFQGVVKRYGTIIQPRKFGKGRRHIGTGGAWKPARKLWKEPLPGQLGYHTRTEYNKLILRMGDKPEEVNPKGGFLHYGLVKGPYVMLEGSIPGPAKRLIRLSNPRRPPLQAEKKGNFSIVHISLESKQKA
jgi:large subunit ribosomal protein L3